MPKKIVVVEDDPAFQRFLTFVLGKEGYQVVVAASGLAGQRLVREEKPDLIILDVMLPGLDGFELCHRIRTEPATSAVPVLMLSAKGQDCDRETAAKVGATKFLPKPVDRVVLIETVAGFLGGS